jgi:hypothetical protein
MKVRIVVDGEKTFDLDDIKELKEIGAYSWEGYSSFTVRYNEEENILLVEYGAEWPRLQVRGKEIKLF